MLMGGLWVKFPISLSMTWQRQIMADELTTDLKPSQHRAVGAMLLLLVRKLTQENTWESGIMQSFGGGGAPSTPLRPEGGGGGGGDCGTGGGGGGDWATGGRGGIGGSRGRGGRRVRKGVGVAGEAATTKAISRSEMAFIA